MRYHYEKPVIYLSAYGHTYICNHPIYNTCTLFVINNSGLAIIQQRFDAVEKVTWWSDIDPWIIDELYLHPHFKEYFDKHAAEPTGDLYPTVTIRQIMWGLKMKPLKKQQWETVFDRNGI